MLDDIIHQATMKFCIRPTSRIIFFLCKENLLTLKELYMTLNEILMTKSGKPLTIHNITNKKSPVSGFFYFSFPIILSNLRFFLKYDKSHLINKGKRAEVWEKRSCRAFTPGAMV